MAKNEITAVRADRKGNLILTVGEPKKLQAKFLRLYNGEIITKKAFLEQTGESEFRQIVLDIFIKADLITQLDSKCEPILIEEKENKEEKPDEKKHS